SARSRTPARSPCSTRRLSRRWRTDRSILRGGIRPDRSDPASFWKTSHRRRRRVAPKGSGMTSERDIDSAAGEDLITEPLEDVIDPEGFTPRLIALLSNALVWRESTELRRRFGLGTNDWPVISAV